MNAVIRIPQWLEQHNTDAATPCLPAWMAEYRQQHWRAFLQNGLPTRKDERWKYADLDFLAAHTFTTVIESGETDLSDVIQQHRLSDTAIMLVLVNGRFSLQYSELSKLPTGVIACDISTAINRYPDLVSKYWPSEYDARRYPFAALNAGMFVDGLFLYVPTQSEVTTPIHILSIATATNVVITHPRHLIVLEQQAKLNLFDQYIAQTAQPYLTNSVTDFYLCREAQLEYVKLQAENMQAFHMAHLFVRQQQDSNALFTSFSIGSQFARDDLVVSLQAPGANCKTGGLYCLDQDNQYIDHHVDIDHQAPRSTSEMLYKGILDKKSKAVFNGRLLVEKDAQKILAYQANHNLLLSNTAEINSKPELEIYADDVKCKHGATTGQLDEEALFYLRSRGIDKETAKRMLLRGFAIEVLARVSDADIRHKLEENLRGHIL